jgi:ABC-2 type transport system ATP-binding protein
MQEVEAMCSRVIILNKGKIISDDTIEAIKKNWDMNTIQTYVKFRDSINEAELSLIDGVESIKSVNERIFVIVSKYNVDIAEELFNFSIASNTIIVEQKEQEKSLESIFQKLTNHA